MGRKRDLRPVDGQGLQLIEGDAEGARHKILADGTRGRDLARCLNCGSDWFLMVDDDRCRGGVKMDEFGVPVQVAGEAACVHCGERWLPTRERFQVIETDA